MRLWLISCGSDMFEQDSFVTRGVVVWVSKHGDRDLVTSFDDRAGHEFFHLRCPFIRFSFLSMIDLKYFRTPTLFIILVFLLVRFLSYSIVLNRL